jgi:hypothetical protein
MSSPVLIISFSSAQPECVIFDKSQARIISNTAYKAIDLISKPITEAFNAMQLSVPNELDYEAEIVEDYAYLLELTSQVQSMIYASHIKQQQQQLDEISPSEKDIIQAADREFLLEHALNFAKTAISLYELAGNDLRH